MVDHQAVVGVLTRTDLLAGIAQRGPATPVAEVMKRDFVPMDPDDLLDDVVARGRAAEAPLVPVLRDGRLVGLLTLENLSEYVLIQHALEARQRQA